MPRTLTLPTYVYNRAVRQCSLAHQSKKVSETPSADLATVVDDLLNQLSTKFTNISSDLIAKSMPLYLITVFIHKADPVTVDEMSRRLDNLEASIQASAARPEDEESK